MTLKTNETLLLKTPRSKTDLPVHVLLFSNVYPSTHIQMNPPSRLTQVPSQQSTGLSLHSFISAGTQTICYGFYLLYLY